MRRWLATSARELAATPAASPLTIAASLVAAVTWLLLLWWWIYKRPWLYWLTAHLGGIVGPTFVVTIVGLAIQLSIIVGFGRLATRDVGLSARSVGRGFAIGVALWLAMQVVLAAAALIDGDGITLAADRFHASRLVDQVAGNALAEEVVFRGFLAVQLVVLARRWWSSRVAWVAGIAASQLFFGVTHIPQRWIAFDLHGTALLLNLALAALIGVFSTILYVRTGMLGVAIAFHALWNLPFAIVDSPLDPKAIYAGAFAVLVVVWPALAGRRARTSDEPPR